MTDHDSYVLRTGTNALERLRILDALTAPSTDALLDRAGVGAGMTAVDAGCGSGLVTLRLAARTGAPAIGFDRDAIAIQQARAAAAHRAAPVTFEVASIESFRTALPIDLAYARFVLSHLTDPAAALRRLTASVRPGGLVIAEDVHFPGHFCAPANAAFDRYVELYEQVSRERGADACLGIELPTLFRAAGLVDVTFHALVPTFTGDDQLDGLTFAARTLDGIGDAVTEARLASAAEVADLVAELEGFARREGTVMSMVRICQTWGRVPD